MANSTTHHVLVPGMNHGAWWYQPVVEALTALGQQAVGLTLSGLEADPRIDRRIVLDTHVADVVAAIDALQAPAGSVVLTGHSYGGLPITAAAEARPEQVRALVYLDAFLPVDGDSAWSLTNDEQRAWYVGDARDSGDTVAPLPFFDDRARPHPVGTLLQAIGLTGTHADVRTRVYVEAAQWPTATPMRTSIDRALADPGVQHRVWDTRHNVLHDGPDRLVDLLRRL